MPPVLWLTAALVALAVYVLRVSSFPHRRTAATATNPHRSRGQSLTAMRRSCTFRFYNKFEISLA
jgi:hypothetical protein